MNLEITRENRVICAECGNPETSTSGAFVHSTKLDDRLSKDNMKLYEVKWVYGGGSEFAYPKIALKVGDVVVTEAIGIDIEVDGVKCKIFDVDHIVAKLPRERA